MAYAAILAAIVALIGLQMETVHAGPKACKVMTPALDPNQEANTRGQDCFNAEAENELHELVMTANKRDYISQKDAATNLGGYTKKNFLGTVDTSDIDGEGKAEACWLVSDKFVNLYSPQWKVPVIVAYTLTKQEVESKPINLPSKVLPFRADLRLSPDKVVGCDTFSKTTSKSNLITTYPGQLISPGHFKSNRAALLNTFVLSSVIPSKKKLHESVWEELDKEAESLAVRYGKVYIASGPIIQDPKHPRWLFDMSGSIVNPKKLFRVFAWCTIPDKEGSCNPQAKFYVINKKTLKKRVFETNSENPITKVELAINCETNIEFDFEPGDKTAKVSTTLATATDQCSEFSESTPKQSSNAEEAQETVSTLDVATSQDVVYCRPAGRKLLNGVIFRPRGKWCVARGCLKEPFGTPQVKLCGLVAAKQEFAMPKPHIRANFYVGTTGQIKGRGMIVINAADPKDFYYRFPIGSISVPSVMSAFGTTPSSLPLAVSKITFAAGAQVMFSSRKRKISGKPLFPGHGIQGNVTVFNIPSKMLMRVVTGKGYTLTIRMPIVNLDHGRIKLYNSFKKAKGPIMHCFIQLTSKGIRVGRLFRTYVSVLGMQDMIRINVFKGNMDFAISGKILGKLQGIYHIYATRNKSGQYHFYASGQLGQDTRDVIEKKVVRGLKRAAEEIKKKVEDVTTKMKASKRETNQLQDLLEKSNETAENAAKALMKAQQKVTALKTKANEICNNKCRKVMAGCVRKVCCGRDPITKACTCHQDRFLPRCKWRRNLACLAITKICENRKKVVQVLLSRAVKVMNAAEVTSAAMNISVKTAEAKLFKAISEAATANKERRKELKAHRTEMKAVHEIIVHGVKGTLFIKEIHFRTTLKQAETGVLPSQLKLLTRSNKVKVIRTNVDVNNLTTAAKFLANSVIPGLGKYVA